jgi:Glycerophosphoryl diester phosphodiesterase
MKLPLIFAHRGASHDAPENTAEAIALGWEMGADGVEIDIRLTRDGRIVLMHDADTIRTTGVQGLVAGRTFADLRKLDAGSWKHPDFSGARVPALEEVLSAIPADKQAIIEIKCGSEILVPLRDILDASGVASSRLLTRVPQFVLR